jgi:hypothetical protein
VNRLPYTAIAAVWHADAAEHRRRATEVGLNCPEDVFEQLFHEPHVDALLMVAVAPVDWASVRWRDAELSAAALAQVALPRSYAPAVQAVRRAAARDGLTDERPEVLAQWQTAGTWLRAPVLIAGDLTGAEASYELLIGRTRLATLLGLVERGDVPYEQRHRIWIGDRAG